MTKIILTLVIMSGLLFVTCKNNLKTDLTIETKNESKMKDITFNLAKNYFVKSTVINLDNPKIETLEKFNDIFGMETIMGKEGKPTEINFNKQYVIAVILNETDYMTTVNPVSLQKNNKNEITLTYKTIIGQKQSYKTRPSFGIIVDNIENGKIKLKELK